MKKISGYLIVGLLSGVTALWVHHKIFPAALPVAATTSEPEVKFVDFPGPLAGQPVDLTGAAEVSVNAVVHVTTESMVQVRDPFAEWFWGQRTPQIQPRQGAGSGVIISDDGYIVTNNHVVKGADKIQVHLNDNRMLEAKVIGTDPSTDLALLKVDTRGLPFIGYGNSDDVRVGEWVLAVGNPFNLTSTVTAGIVSAKARNINLLQYDPGRDIIPLESFIQTDAAVNPGNSGGALVNVSGDLVGINTAIASQTGSYTGYSFAIPVNIVKKVINDLLEFGEVQRAFIGVSIRDMDQSLADKAGMQAIRGVFVNGITNDGAAEKAGMQPGDIILKVGALAVDNVPQLQEQIGKFRPGDRVTLTIWRDKAERILDLRLRNKDGLMDLSNKPKDLTTSILGAEVGLPDQAELKALELDHGVKVLQINGGRFRSSGIREGFIITRVDKTPIRRPEDLSNILKEREGGVLIEGVYPNGMKAYYGLGV